MSGLIASLYCGQSGLQVNQIGIEVTGNNVANADTEGYSRQVVQTVSAPSLEYDGCFVGQGATVSGISRAESALVTRQLAGENAAYGEQAAQADALAALESIVGVDEGSLSSTIDDFFAAWQTLSANPGESLEREQVLQAGEQLATDFRQMDQDLADLQDGIDESLAAQVETLNSQLEQIADLNSQIVTMEAQGVSANGLRDDRDQLLQEVATAIGVQYYEGDDGAVSLQLASGAPLVMGDQAATLVGERSDGRLQLSVAFGSSTVSLDSDDLGGEIKGLLTVRDETIAEARAALDELAWQFATSVNEVHAGGTDLDGQAGAAFFSLSTVADDSHEGAAASIALALSDSDQVAAGSSDATDALSGDNSNALAMLALQSEQVMDGGATFQETYEQLAAGIGVTVARNETATETAEDALVQLQNMRDSVAGVSIDEEMVLLTRYQSGYEASAKYLAVVQNLLDTLMSL